MASSSASVKKYDVFISFRGTDTRKGFTSILYSALCDKRIETFIDSDDLEKGDEISPVLLRAIEASAISMVIFSENYAESRWCLDELNHIVHCKETLEQLVLPVFYNVDPTNIRHQQGSFRDAFSQHGIRFGNEPEKLEEWRKSLRTTADLSGWNLAEERSEADLAKKIVKFITEKLQDRISSIDYMKDLIGTEYNIQKIESALCIGLLNEGVHIVGIWGMGGIGKTTLARALFNKLSSQFFGSSFLENVSEEVKKHQPSDLQARVFSQLLNEKDLRRVTDFDKQRLSGVNVLLVLDNVDHVNQLDHLAKDRSWFGPGSRIIVTSRYLQVLRNIKADEICEVKELSFGDAIRLFLSKAFGKEGSPTEGYSKLAETVVKKYAKGNPLALIVLGLHLYSKSIEEWKSAMKSLDSSQNKEVQASLRVSYDGLSDEEKDIFLDIACFFKGRYRDSAQTILGYRYPGVVIGITVLSDKCLMSVNDRGEIWMHDLIQEMGQEIVRRESNDPGERTRLWSTPDIFDVLEDNGGTPKMQGIFLSSSVTSETTNQMTISPLVFKEMRNLWFLRIDSFWSESYFLFPENLDFLPARLRYVYWSNFPLKSLPPSFNPKNLCDVTFSGNKLERLWHSKYKDLQKLEFLNLKNCLSLNKLPDLSCAANLKELFLSGCNKITQLPDLSHNSKLEKLNLIYCTNLYQLQNLPQKSNLKRLNLDSCIKLYQVPDLTHSLNLEELILSGCSNLSQLPNLSHNSNLVTLNLDNCRGLNQLPDLSHNTNLTTLNLENCRKLNQVPSLSHASNLKWLNLRFCESINKFPLLPNPCNITHLDMSKTKIKEVPVFIECLTSVTVLSFNYCYFLKTLPITICKLKSLKFLKMEENSNLEHFPEILEPMESLKELLLDGTRIKELHPSIETLSRLKLLSLKNCKHLEKLPYTIFLMWSLDSVKINGCLKLILLPKLPFSMSTCTEPQSIHVEQHIPRHLDANGCKSEEFASKPWITFEEELELDRFNIVAEFNSRVLAGDVVIVSSEPKLQHVREVDFWFLGEEISKWFCYQSDGSSVTVLPRCYEPNFIGFAVCANISFQTGYFGERFSLVWESCFATERGDIITKSHRPFSKWMGTCNLVIMQSFRLDCNGISDAAQLSFKSAGISECFGIKRDARTQVRKCGVRLLYRQDAEEFQRQYQKKIE